MFTNETLTEWFKLKRPMWSDIRIVIHNDIAFVYGKMTKTNQERNIARILLTAQKSFDALNPFQWL